MKPTEHVAIIGKGMIGISWAVMFTGNGIGVTVLAKEPEIGLQRYRGIFQDLVKQGLVTEKQATKCEKLLSFTEDYAGISGEEIIFECVTENLDVKHDVYEKIAANCPKVRAIASATSALPPADLAAGMTAKEKIFVAHPWNPPHMVPLVEVVHNDYTDAAAVKDVAAILEYCGREVAYLKKPCPGFIGNRLQHALFREAIYMVEQGICSPEDIDRVVRASFAPRYTSIGLFDHMDYTGLDLLISVDDKLFPHLCNDTSVANYIRDKVAKGDIGYKSGVGVYDWRERDMDNFRYKTGAPYLKLFNWKLPED